MRSVVTLILVGALFGMPVLAQATTGAPEANPTAQRIDRIIDALTPQERVGQLMLVTFEGAHLASDSALSRLITEYNLGGVVLLAENDNINGQVNTPRLVRSFTTTLQTAAYDAAQATKARTDPRPYLPLLIATTHLGDGQPGTQIALGTTPLPSQMALGATWDPENARSIGQIAGNELSAMGVNMLFGPTLDMSPQSEQTIDLGVDTFGSEPFWVGLMAQAYVTGVHEGSNGRVALIANNFPGLGLADTLPDQEIPVIPRTLAELAASDMLPFFAVTGEASEPLAQVEGVQCANIRYLAPNTSSVTQPVCLDEEAASKLLSVETLADWRTHGVMVSSPLGTRAIRRYYNVTPFPHRQVAREALLAGNDLLYLSDFGPRSGDDQLENVIDVIEFFADTYEDDPVFQAQVDIALRRVLELKLSLYDGDVTLENVLRVSSDIDAVGEASSVVYTMAQESVTLLSPSRESLPMPPDRDDDIVIFTDVRLVQQCSFCAAYPVVNVNALEVAIENIYGPYGGAQIRPERVTSFSMGQLMAYFDSSLIDDSESIQFKTSQRIAEALRDVEWIVFVMLDFSPDEEGSTVLRHLLASESALADRANVVAIALGAPTYLSATEISKLAAYYAVYSHTPAYVNAAARALFHESALDGALPISVPALGYDVSEMTEPDTAQVLTLDASTVSGQPLSDPPTVQVGEQVTLSTRALVDVNGNVVPDDTPVEFTLTFLSEDLQTRQYSVTQGGVAYINFAPTRPGRVRVAATSVNATRSVPLDLMVLGEGAVLDLTAQAAILGSDAVLPPATEATESAGARPNGTARTPASNSDDTGNAPPLDLQDLGLALLGLSMIGLLAFSVGLGTTLSAHGGWRVVLISLVAGLTGYIYYGLGAPGTQQLATQLDDMAALTVTVLCGLVGGILGWWNLRREVVR